MTRQREREREREKEREKEKERVRAIYFSVIQLPNQKGHIVFSSYIDMLTRAFPTPIQVRQGFTQCVLFKNMFYTAVYISYAHTTKYIV